MTEKALLNYLEKHQNGKWKSFDTTIDSIEWWDGVKPPEINIIEEGVKVEQKILDDTQYQRDRLLEYPSIQELVVALYDESDKASIIERRNAVKAKYPKPE